MHKLHSMGQAVNVLSLQLVLATSLLLLSGKLCRYRAQSSVCVASLAFVYLCQSEKPCHLNIKTVYAFSPTLKQTRQSTGNREIQKRVAAITQSEAGKDPKSSACAHKVHINIHSELPLTHFLTNTHTHWRKCMCTTHMHFHNSVRIPVDTSFAGTANCSRRGRGPHTLSCSQSVTAGHDPPAQPNAHNRKDRD